MDPSQISEQNGVKKVLFKSNDYLFHGVEYHTREQTDSMYLRKSRRYRGKSPTGNLRPRVLQGGRRLHGRTGRQLQALGNGKHVFQDGLHSAGLLRKQLGPRQVPADVTHKRVFCTQVQIRCPRHVEHQNRPQHGKGPLLPLLQGNFRGGARRRELHQDASRNLQRRLHRQLGLGSDFQISRRSVLRLSDAPIGSNLQRARRKRPRGGMGSDHHLLPEPR